MKKIIYSLFLLLIIKSASAQSQRLVLVEEFTNAGCGPCYYTNPPFDALMSANSTKAIAIRYHTNWPGFDPMNMQNAAQNQARVVYYQVSSVPQARQNGGGIFVSDVTQASIDAGYATPSPLKMSLSFYLSSDGDSINIRQVVKATAAVSGTLKAHLVVIEKHIHFSGSPGSNGETDFYNVMKKMLPTEQGTALPATMAAGDSVVIISKWLLASIYDINQLAVVGFVQNNVDKTVLQSAYAPSATSPSTIQPPTIAASTVSPAFCGNTGSINITIIGGVTPYSYRWSNAATTQSVSGLASGNYIVTVTGGTARTTRSFTVPQQSIAAPSGLLAPNVTQCVISFKWTGVQSATNYMVKIKKTSDATWSTPVQTSSVPTYTFTGLNYNTSYDIAVASFCGGSSYSNYTQISVPTLGCTMPTNISVNNIGVSSATINWTGNCANPLYRIRYRMNYASAPWYAAASASTSKILRNLQPGTTYLFKMRSICDSVNYSTFTQVYNFTTMPLRLAAADELAANANELLQTSVYPNPSTGSFTVSIPMEEEDGTAYIEVRNLLGQMIYNVSGTSTDGYLNKNISIDNLADGIYFVKTSVRDIETVNKVFIRK